MHKKMFKKVCLREFAKQLAINWRTTHTFTEMESYRKNYGHSDLCGRKLVWLYRTWKQSNKHARASRSAAYCWVNVDDDNDKLPLRLLVPRWHVLYFMMPDRRARLSKVKQNKWVCSLSGHAMHDDFCFAVRVHSGKNVVFVAGIHNWSPDSWVTLHDQGSLFGCMPW